MIPELSILKHYCTYQEWVKHRDSLAVTDFPRELQGIVRCLYNYHVQNEAAVDISVRDLANIFFATLPKDREFYQGVFDQLDKADSSASTVQTLIDSINRGNLLRELSTLTYETAEGKGKIEDVLKKIEELQTLSKAVDSGESLDGIQFVSDDIEDIITRRLATPGLRWRLNTLNKMFGSLRRSNFGFIFARPETGKTTFLASEVTFMAEQLDPETQGPILWLNNEQDGEEVMTTIYRAALGIDNTTLYRDLKGWKKRFHDVTKGRIKLYDSGSIHKKTVEKLCRTLKPSLIICDQIDKIQGFDSDREDLRLGTIYQWARELAKEYAPFIAVCQADGTGEGQRWLTMAHVANAKTAKQAEADWILGIGKVHDTGFENIRYLHASKNKLTGDEDSDPSMRHGREEVLIQPEIARYKDI